MNKLNKRKRSLSVKIDLKEKVFVLQTFREVTHHAFVFEAIGDFGTQYGLAKAPRPYLTLILLFAQSGSILILRDATSRRWL